MPGLSQLFWTGGVFRVYTKVFECKHKSELFQKTDHHQEASTK